MKEFRFRGLLLLLLLTSIVLLGCAAPECTKATIYERNLHALVDTTEIEGSFFLASGRIASQYVYRFTEELEDGGKFTRDVPGDEAIVYEHNDSEKAWVVKLSANAIQCVPDNTVNVSSLSGFTWYEIHVPTGTIREFTEIDLE